MISGFFAIVLLKFFAQKMGKVRASIMGLGIAFTCMLVRVVSQDQIIPLYLACLLVAGFGLSLFASLVIPNIMDSIDYGEWKTGVRSDALVMSANSFGTKIGQGLGTASIAFMLDAMGYDETLAVQTESCVNGIHWLATLLPLIMYGVLIVLMLVIYRYEKKMPAIRAELAARREKAQ